MSVRSTNVGSIQLVWWWHRPTFKLLDPLPAGGAARGCVYAWRLYLGFVEIRRWGCW